MNTIAMISNSNAGKGESLRKTMQSNKVLWGRKIIRLNPSSLQELSESAHALDQNDVEAAIVVGGDGTINQVLEAVYHSNIPLYPFPAGTANDLATELGITADWSQAQRLLDQRKTKTIDLISVNGKLFATVAGIGLGTIPIQEYNERRKRSRVFKSISKKFGSEIYSLLSAKAILTSFRKSKKVHIKSDVFTETLDIAALFVCNQTKLGGSMMVAPHSQNDDRKFKVLAITQRPAISLIKALNQLRDGKQPEDFVLFATDRLEIYSLDQTPIHVFGDGEMILSSKQLTFTIVPQAIRVFQGEP